MESSPRTLLDRPVFIMAAPRSGSTLLFETLTVSESLWSLGDEAHALVERHPELRPDRSGTDSNRLTAEHLTAALAEAIRGDLTAGMRDCDGRAYAGAPGSVRLLEKTPKNILRIPFFDALFPDARFIYLYRDSKENLSSIMEGWRSGRFVTYPAARSRNGPWSFLLPPGWRAVLDAPLGEVAAFQWRSAHRHALQDLGALSRDRWMGLSYAELLQQTPRVVERLCRFIGIPMDGRLRERCSGRLPLSRYSLSTPSKDKWKKNARDIAAVLPDLAETVAAINRAVGSESWPLNEDPSIDPAGHDAVESLTPVASSSGDALQAAAANVRRNDPCPCGSGRRYKACHGNLTSRIAP